MLGSRYSIFRFADVEVREREFSLTKAGKVLTVEPKGHSDSKQRRNQDLRGGRHSQGRTLPIRFEEQTVSALPRGNFRPGRLLLQRRQFGGLCLLSRIDPVEGQPGWEQPRPAERPADPGFPAPL